MTDSRLRRAVRFSNVYWRAAAGAAYALTAGLAQRRHRGLLTQVARHFGYDDVAADATLPTISLEEMVPAGLALDLRELRGVDGNVSPLELIVIAGSVARLHARTVFEIGTFDGRTTLNLAANAAPGGTVYTLDLPPAGAGPSLAADADDHKYLPGAARAATRIGDASTVASIHQLYGDSASFDFAPYRAKIDVCFVDGAHSYDYVLSDSRHALEMTREGGIILWHDYGTWRGVTTALNELQRAGGAFGALRQVEGTALAVLQRERRGA